ncbi:hypothetical protein BN8_01584 [Fibrisoma limi BUZ 3]|uniref:Uncharacterized protein n=1 Tax=Fibrisoma limi BUZ 3 TaxID=1185876 RepID=I2GF98_9BACT|nr:hypothetical protein [Fibrisoma limi]CCH52573.1 hypothetical protein BN8_01584 [Fibrisoma limi BUZ 3]
MSRNPPKRNVVVTLDTYLSILAVISSFCAIGITFYQAYLQRTQQYASVMPVLDSYKDNGGDSKSWHLTYILVNNGIGPAFIQKAEITYKGKVYPDIRSVIYAVVKDGLAQGKAKPAEVINFAINQSTLYPTRILPVGEEVKLCNLDHKYVARWVDEASHRKEIRFKVWYKSIYGEQWLFNSAPDRIELTNIKVDD